MEDLKQCNKCKRCLPRTDEYFHYNKESKDGFQTICKECRGYTFGKSKPRAERKRSKDNLGIVDGKIECNKCFRWLPLDENHFFKHSRSLLGFEAICKECKGREFGVHWKMAELQLIDGTEYKQCTKCNLYKENTDVYFGYARGSGLDAQCRMCVNKYQRESERIQDSSKKSRTLPKRIAKIKEYRTVYYQRPNAKELKKNREQKRRSIKSNCSYSLTQEEWMDTISNWTDVNGDIHCAYCDKKILHPDQEHVIPLSKNGGYVKENIIPVGGARECACNQSKNNKTLNEFYIFSDSFSKESYLKIKEFILHHSSKEHSESYVFLF